MSSEGQKFLHDLTEAQSREEAELASAEQKQDWNQGLEKWLIASLETVRVAQVETKDHEKLQSLIRFEEVNAGILTELFKMVNSLGNYGDDDDDINDCEFIKLLCNS